MDKKQLGKFRARADTKLRYSKIYLDELMLIGKPISHDIDRAHQESFLYHLLGAKEAFIQELNVYYSGGLDQNAVSPGALRERLSKEGKISKELAELYLLENDNSSWLFHAKEMRDHSTHIGGVPRVFYAGGENDGNIHLKNPKTSEELQNHFVDEFAEWHKKMGELLERLRENAIQENKQ